jgi:glycerol-3-phosphate dehydrogenase (NAD(P)+)
MSTPQVAVLGAGSWGTTVAALASHNAPTTLWARRDEVAREVTDAHTNERYLPGYSLPSTLTATSTMADAVRGAELVVVGVPSHGFRAALGDLKPHLAPGACVLSLSKGLEQGSHLRMTELIEKVLPGHPAAVLTGPNLAREIMAGQAAASVVGSRDAAWRERVQAVFRSGLFRVYTNHDVAGCELGGALKNVIAIASGMGDGVGVGDNTRSAVITRGLAELSRLGVRLGGEPATFAGLAGMGDLIATCISTQSRNRHVGEQLGKGRTIDEIIEEMTMVAEGVKTCGVVMELAERFDIQMPIAREVYGVIHEGRSALQAYRGLIRTRPGSEDEPG